MSAIYGTASQVIVWLGDSWPGAEVTLEFLQRLGEDETLHLEPSLDPSITVNGLKLDSKELCEHLIRIFDLPWWKRTWTIQDFVLAKDLVFQCSSGSISRDLMYMARENFWGHKDRCCPVGEWDTDPALPMSLGRAFEVPARLDFITKSRGHTYSVLTAAATFCKRGMSDPRDRIYGMLGLGTGEYASLVQPDYSLSPEQVCEAVAIESVERTGTLEFLSHLFEHKNTKLPSFLPNWTGKFDWNDIYSLRLGNVRYFSTSTAIRAKVKLVAPGILATQGAIFDTITATSPGADLFNYLLQPDSLVELLSLAGLETPSEDPYCHTTDSRLVAFWHTLCGGMEMTLRDSNRFAGRLKGSTDLSKWSKLATFLTAQPHFRAEQWDNELGHIFPDIETATRGRKFFVTKRGCFGLAPRKCEIGDFVVVLVGGNVPYIIHSASSSSPCPSLSPLSSSPSSSSSASHEPCESGDQDSRRYTILGDSYVHGIMDGELFDLLDETERRLEEIMLV